mmetsp:Transcript_41379/g.81756  ORF Transcript_41379/g.81756 Transcript_41379/m.81756 type:complete len:114 (+) Transcript_41379:48-389(+)
MSYCGGCFKGICGKLVPLLLDKPKVRAACRELFKKVDIDNTGTITAKNIEDLLNKLAGKFRFKVPAGAAQMAINAVDQTKSGDISEEEFCQMGERFCEFCGQKLQVAVEATKK